VPERLELGGEVFAQSDPIEEFLHIGHPIGEGSGAGRPGGVAGQQLVVFLEGVAAA